MELALKTITTPKASRQRVTVSSSEYSTGGAPARCASRARRAPQPGVRARGANLPRLSAYERLHQGAEVLAALLEVAVGVEARARRGEQHDLARARAAAAAARTAVEVAAAAQLDAGAAAGARSRSSASAASPIR